MRWNDSQPPLGPEVPLEAEVPFEMRVHLGEDVPETDVRSALKTGDIGFLHSFTTGSAVDGPGIRLVAWTTACMFRCQYLPQPRHLDADERHSGDARTARSTRCANMRNGLKAMSGGFTLSGGEPLMQDRFAARLFAAAKQMGVHTAIETNGFYGERLSDEELTNIDLVILDMKAFTPEQHKRVTGMSTTTTVLDFCKRLAALKRPMWLRYVLVPGLTDIPEEMEGVAASPRRSAWSSASEILPFHQMGRYKWERLGIRYELEETQPPTADLVNQAIEIFQAAGLDAA